jgi:hypothetical protein
MEYHNSVEDMMKRGNSLLSGCSYPILQVRDIYGHKLIQIYNLWDYDFIWDGPWGRKSAFWTPDMLDLLK